MWPVSLDSPSCSLLPRRRRQVTEKLADTKTNLEREDKTEILFGDAPYHVVDHRHFIAELLTRLQALGATNSAISKLHVALREGSIIADVNFPASDIAEIKKLPLDRLMVLGYRECSGTSPGLDTDLPPMRQAERDFGFGFSSARRNSERGEDSVDTPSIASEDLRASTHGVRRLADLDTFDEESDSDDSEPSGPIKGREPSTARVRVRPKPPLAPRDLLEALLPPRFVGMKPVKAADESMHSGVTALEKYSYTPSETVRDFRAMRQRHIDQSFFEINRWYSSMVTVRSITRSSLK